MQIIYKLVLHCVLQSTKLYKTIFNMAPLPKLSSYALQQQKIHFLCSFSFINNYHWLLFFLSSFPMPSEPQFLKKCIYFWLNHTIPMPTILLFYCDITNHPEICGEKQYLRFMLMGFRWDCAPQYLRPQPEKQMASGLNLWRLLHSCLVPEIR